MHVLYSMADDSAFLLRPGDTYLSEGSSSWSHVRSGSKSRQSSMSEVGNLPGSVTSTTSLESSQCQSIWFSVCFQLGLGLDSCELQMPCSLRWMKIQLWGWLSSAKKLSVWSSISAVLFPPRALNRDSSCMLKLLLVMPSFPSPLAWAHSHLCVSV